MIGQAISVWENNPTYKVQDRDESEILQIAMGIAQGNYSTIDKPIIVDKSRSWPAPQIMETMSKVMGEAPKIIATVRNVPDCAASFVRIAKPENLDKFLLEGGLIEHLKTSYLTLEAGYAEAPENFCIIDYDDLMDDPKSQLNKIEQFLELEPFEYDITNIESSAVKEKDEEVWNIPDLHKVAPKLERQHSQSALDVLGPRYADFMQARFWLGETPEDRELTLLDKQLEASKVGDFELGWELAQQLEKEEPLNNRAAYNRGWYLLNQGRLSKGHRLLDKGRLENVFGNRVPNTPQPMWTGTERGTILLNLEGGLGDQIWGVRFAKNISALGNKTIVACSGELIPTLKDCPGVTAIIDHSAVGGVYHDYWVPSMSAILPLGLEYKDISGKPYIGKHHKYSNPKRLRVGVRWQGNPRFEHEQHRVFPPELLFNVLENYDIDVVSLQRDEGAQHTPSWMLTPNLDTWEDTRIAISECDLVISSCTSVAHLSAAMGKKTWIISPILPYFLWAPPGEKTCWYNTATIFKQTKPNEWEETFDIINNRLRGEV
jgi:hypothetical protein